MKSKLIAAYRLGRIDTGHDDLTADHYDKLIADLRRRRDDESDQDVIDTRLNEAAHETRCLD